MNCNNCNLKNCKCSEKLETIRRLKEYNENYPIFAPNWTGSIDDQLINKYLFSDNINLIYNRQVNDIASPISDTIEPCAFDFYIAGKFQIQIEYNNYIVANCTYDIPGVIPQNVCVPLTLDSDFFQDNVNTKYMYVLIKPLSDIYIRELVINTAVAGISQTFIQPCNIIRVLTFYDKNVDVIQFSIREVCRKASNILINSPGIVFKPLVSYGQLFRSTDLQDLMEACFESIYLQNFESAEVVYDESLASLVTLQKSINTVFSFGDFDIFKYAKQKMSDMYTIKIQKYEKQIDEINKKLEIKKSLKIYVE